MKPKLNQPDMFPDVNLLKPVPGTDVGLQSDMFGQVFLRATEPTEACQEAADIIKRGTMYHEKYIPWRKP